MISSLGNFLDYLEERVVNRGSPPRGPTSPLGANITPTVSQASIQFSALVIRTYLVCGEAFRHGIDVGQSVGGVLEGREGELESNL
jgi:hypothetical protein